MDPTGSISGVSFCDSLSLSEFASEKEECESFCKVIPLERNVALSALRDLKIFLGTEGCLGFEKLRGGDCNAPVLIFKFADFHKTPIGVLKHEPDSSWAEKRMRAMDEMRKDGFEYLPRILKDKKEKYLIRLGETSYSCIEYLEPDSNQSSTIEQMFMAASSFHSYSKRSPLTEELRGRALDRYCDDNISHLDPELMKWNPSIFSAETWETCVKCANYFTTQSFLKIYNSLPVQLIHGDITPNNIIISKGNPFFIDLDKVRTDVRLLDFATFSGWSFLERYLALIEEDKLFSCIQACYGTLEEVEKDCFSIVVLFGRFCVLGWALRELKQSLCTKDWQKEQQFGGILVGTIREINEIYKRIPQIKEAITR